MSCFHGNPYLAHLAEADDSKVEPANDLLRGMRPGFEVYCRIVSRVPRFFPVHVREGNVDPVLCSSGLPVQPSIGHIPDAWSRRAMRHARGAKCRVTRKGGRRKQPRRLRCDDFVFPLCRALQHCLQNMLGVRPSVLCSSARELLSGKPV